MDSVQPLLILLLFVPSLATGLLCAALVLGMRRAVGLDMRRAKTLVATVWWAGLSAALWIGSDQLFSSRSAGGGVFMAAILIWVFVILPAPLIGTWILALRSDPRACERRP